MSNYRYKSIPALTFLMFVLFMQIAHAEALNGPDIRTALIGQVFEGEYPDGRQWGEKFNRDGTTKYWEGPQSFWGAMSIVGKLVCFTYSATSGVSGGCFEVWKRGSNCYDFYGSSTPGSTQTSATRVQKLTGQAWSARGWNQSKPADCTSEAIS